MNMHKLSIETSTEKITIELDQNSSFDDYLNAFKTLMVGITFSTDVISGYLIEHAEMLKEE